MSLFQRAFINSASKEEILGLYPEEVQALLERSALYLENTFTFTHPEDMERCTRPVKFTGDWELIPFGDPEWCWVFNRHRFLEELALAYFLTGEHRYLDHFSSLLDDWISKNSHPEGHIKGSWRRIEAGIRIAHWVKSIELISMLSPLPSSFEQRIWDSLMVHGRYLASEMSAHSHVSNWGILEYHGLLIIALACPCKESSPWLELAVQRLCLCLEIQVLEDGSQWECSPMYHNEVCRSALDFLFLSRKHGLKIPQNIEKSIEKMVWACIAWQKPNFKQLQRGDSDDTDTRGIISYGAALFENASMASRGSAVLDIGLYLLFGPEQSQAYASMPRQKPPFCSAQLPSTGMLMLRDSWTEESSYLAFYTRKLAAGHGHDDLHHISYYANKKDYLIDGGRFSYTDSPERQDLKMSYGHNTLILNGREHAQYKSSWVYSKEARSLAGGWHSAEGVDIAYGHNLSYLEEGYSITRTVLKFGGQGFFLCDTLVQPEGKDTSLEWKFNSPQHPSQKDGFILLGDDLTCLHSPCCQSILEASYYSPHYNEKSPAFQIKMQARSRKSAAYGFLFAFPQASLTSVAINNCRGGIMPSSEAAAYKIVLGSEEYIFLNRFNGEIQDDRIFMEFGGMYYVHSKVILKKEAGLYRVVLKVM